MVSDAQWEDLNAMFKFRIGDVVVLRAAGKKSEFRYVVCVRMIVEDEAGAGALYQCRGVNALGQCDDEQKRFSEQELERSEAFS